MDDEPDTAADADGTSDTEQLAPVTPDPTSPAPMAGWYVDPWDDTCHRFWDGQAWTARTFPNGPRTAGERPPAWAPSWRPRPEPPAADSAAPPPPPSWAPPPPAAADALSPAPSAPPAAPKGRGVAIAALVIGLIVGFVIAFAAGTALHRHRTSSSAALTPFAPPSTRPLLPVTPTAPASPGSPNPSSPNPASPNSVAPDPAASALSGLVLQQRDVSSAFTVAPIPRGDQVGGEVTLDLCGATYPSESLRTARLQVAAVDAQGDSPLGTEAVLYGTPNGSAQAFTELRSAAASCPSTPRTSATGDTQTTHINPAPDGAWPQTTGVERLAFDFTTTDQQGQTSHWVAVYLRRERVLEGVYFDAPDGAQPAVAGQTTIPGIVGVFAARIAALPAATVNG